MEQQQLFIKGFWKTNRITPKSKKSWN